MPGIEGFELPKALEIDKATKTDRFAKFIAEPWEHGYGNTIGNALRRVLLSSMEGVAVTNIRISYTGDNDEEVKVPHEFASIPDVLEDVMDIVLNVKKLKFRCCGELPRTLNLEASNAGEVTGAAIHEDGVTEVLNPEQVICTLDKDRPFHMELEIDKGRGYRPSEQNKRADAPILTIPVDSLFSPIETVSYEVQACRKDNIMDMDRLVLCVWTDGRIAPEDAVKLSAKILMKHFEVFTKDDIGEVGAMGGAEPAGGSALSPEALDTVEKLLAKVEALELSVRAVNVLQTLQIRTMFDLVRRNEQELLKLRNCGKKTVQEIKQKLLEKNLVIGMELSEEIKNEVERRLAAEASENKGE